MSPQKNFLRTETLFFLSLWYLWLPKINTTGKNFTIAPAMQLFKIAFFVSVGHIPLTTLIYSVLWFESPEKPSSFDSSLANNKTMSKTDFNWKVITIN